MKDTAFGTVRITPISILWRAMVRRQEHKEHGRGMGELYCNRDSHSNRFKFFCGLAWRSQAEASTPDLNARGGHSGCCGGLASGEAHCGPLERSSTVLVRLFMSFRTKKI